MHEKHSKDCFQTKVKHPDQVHAWGVISPNDPGILKRVDG